MTGTAVVTGASSGIGRAIALELARRGWRLGLIGRDGQRLTEVARACGDAAIAAMDIRDTDAFAAFVAGVGDIDLYVSNHGILDGRRGSDLIEAPDAALEVLDINLRASVAALHRVLPAMRERGKGQVVLVSSLGGLSPLADAPAYSASKAGLVMYGLGLREALHGTGVGISVCCPGYVATHMGDQHLGHRPHEISAGDAARRIVDGALANKRLFGFPRPLWPLALFSLLVPERLSRLFTRNIRFTVGGR